MKLEVGKKYVDRDGYAVEILSEHFGMFWGVCGDQYRNYLVCGTWLGEGSNNDLVKEYVEPRTKEVWLEFTSLSHDGIVVTDLQVHDEKPPRRGMSIAIKKVTITEGEFDE